MKLRFALLALFIVVFSGLSRAQTATPETTATPEPDPYAPLEQYTIEAMRARDYPAGIIEKTGVLQITETYIRYTVRYQSDNLTVSGLMQVPPGNGPFPVIILNHGYIRQADYWSGYETWEAAAYLNRNGYLTIAPDYRSWGASDWGLSLFHGGLTVDVLNLVSALGSIPQADTTRVGMWGHSMGGGITMKAVAVDPRIDAAVLYASNSADDADLVGFYGPGCIHNVRAGRRCNRGEVIPEDTDRSLFEAYLAAARDSEFLARVSPWTVLREISVPVQIHTGSRDTVVPTGWSSKLYKALRNFGKNAELYTYEGQDHTFYGEAWTLYIERTTAFFDAYVKNAG